MAGKKTMFAGDSAFEDMLRASSLGSGGKEDPDKAGGQRRPPEKKAVSPRAERQTKPAAQPEKAQLNLYIDPGIYNALGLRKVKARAEGAGGDRTFVGIVEAALALYLADEIRSIGTRGL